jgi:hypothetical protein
VHTGPGVFAPRPGARSRTVWVAVLLSVVVVSLLGSAAPGFADGPAGGRSDDRGGAERRADVVGEVHEKPDRIEPGRGGGDAPVSPPAAPPSAAPAGPARAARTAAPAAAPPANVLTEAPAALAAPVVGLTAPVLAPAAPAAAPVAPANPAAPAAPSPAPLADVLLLSAPPLAPPAGAVVPASSPRAAPVGAASPAAAPVPDAPAPAQIEAAPPPAGAPGADAGGERRAASPRTVAERSFTVLLLLMAAVLVFLAVHGRVDRRDPKLGDRPGDFRRFR